MVEVMQTPSVKRVASRPNQSSGFLSLSIVNPKRFIETEDLTTRCQELLPVCLVSEPRTSVVAAAEGNLLLLLCFELHSAFCCKCS